MEYSFLCYGHENILATHKATIEFTKDSGLSLNGNCIVGIRCDFDPAKLRKISKNEKSVFVEIAEKNSRDHFSFLPNEDFSDNHEIVIRKSNFLSNRTIGTGSEKAAIDIDRKIISKLKKGIQFRVTLRY